MYFIEDHWELEVERSLAVFGFDYGMHLLWHRLISLRNVTTFISVQSCIHFSPSLCTDDGRFRPLSDIFSSTSQKLSVGFRSGHCGRPVHVWKWCLTLSESHFHNSSPINGGIVILDKPMPSGRKSPLMEKLVIQYIHIVRAVNMFWADNDAEPRPDQLNQPQIITLPPQACTAGTRHDGCITSFASLLTLIYPSHRYRASLDSSDHMTFFSRV